MKKLMLTVAFLLGLQAHMTHPFLDEYAESFNNGLKHGIQNGISDAIREPLKHWSKKFAEDTYQSLKENKEIVAATACVLVLAVVIYSYFKNKKSEPCVIHKKDTRTYTGRFVY